MADLPPARRPSGRGFALTAEATPAPIRRKMFVKASTVPKLSPERLRRQSLITHLACSLLDDAGTAIRFLNQANVSLGGTESWSRYGAEPTHLRTRRPMSAEP